ncbi:hypothetical protein [Candidatus Thiosymbion oneisti]|uniref:hypothetical protein n=1 Tax=Candidatus Thiosymbion oneisti TaxID=589554 RepID=UPI00114CB09D|nr:hypothetical protein [Candidatus Thiosymbion oneisti]
MSSVKHCRPAPRLPSRFLPLPLPLASVKLLGLAAKDRSFSVHNHTGPDIYQKIEPDFTVLNAVEKQLGWNLTEPFVFCQTRMRDTDQLSKDILPRGKLAKLIEAVAREVKVVLLSFHTGRWLDSYSEFENYPNCFRYPCKSFPEQACLIHFAKHCLFFTEGDFGSQIYVPPFLGKDVTAIAPSTVYRIGSTPIDLWNRNLFRFGGQIIPKVSEEVFASKNNMMKVVIDTLN